MSVSDTLDTLGHAGPYRSSLDTYFVYGTLRGCVSERIQRVRHHHIEGVRP
jgi:hypothetical protein